MLYKLSFVTSLFESFKGGWEGKEEGRVGGSQNMYAPSCALLTVIDTVLNISVTVTHILC